MPWLHCQKFVGLEYWVQLVFNFTPMSVAKCRPSLNAA